MLYAIAAVIVALGIIIALKYGQQSLKNKRYNLLITFVLTLFAAFSGVLLAFQLSELQQERLARQQEHSDKQLLIAVINISVNEIDDQMLHLNSFSNYLKEKQNEQEAKNILESNPIKDVIMLDTLIANPSFSRYCSPVGAGTIISFAKSKGQWLELANRPDVTLQGNFTGFQIYVEYLEDLKTLLLTEIDYINGKITDMDVLDRLGNLHLSNPLAK